MYKIQPKDDAEHVIRAPCRVPAPVRQRLKTELNRMSELQVITKAEEPTEWVNAMVSVDKKNKSN